MNKKRNLFLSIFFTVISIVYTLIVKNIDVKAIGPNNSSVGLSSLNNWFKNLIGINMDIYKLTEILGLCTFVIVGIYGVTGLIMLIKRKSLFKVDREIISLGVLYVLMGIIYLLFEKVVINYRPILIDGELEASYPSSHTLLSICICISSLIVSKKYLDNKKYNIFTFLTMLLLTLVFIGRTISGVHYLSDIIGGVIISINLLMIFYTILRWKNNN